MDKTTKTKIILRHATKSFTNDLGYTCLNYTAPDGYFISVNEKKEVGDDRKTFLAKLQQRLVEKVLLLERRHPLYTE